MFDTAHLIDDPRLGGVQSNIRQLLRCSDCKSNHKVMTVSSAKPYTARQLKARNIVVHFSIAWRKLPYLLALRAKNPTSRLILQEHHYSAEHFANRDGALARFRTLMAITNTIFNRMIAVSEKQASWYLAQGIKVEAVINPMTDLDLLFALQVAPPRDVPVIGISGRLDHTKGFDTVLNLLGQPLARSLKFLIAGYGELRCDIESAARRLDNVEFIGRYKHPAEYLAQCDVVLIPSRLETFGLAALEAKAAGRPILVANTGGLTAQADNCGISVPPGDSLSVAEGLVQLIHHKNFTALGRAGQVSARKHNPLAQQQWSIQLSEA